MTTVSCVMPRSVHWPSLRHTIKARTTPRNCGSLKPNRTPLTCGSPYMLIFIDYFFPNFFTPAAEVMAVFSDRNIIACSQSTKCDLHASVAERAPVRQLPKEAGKMAASTDWWRTAAARSCLLLCQVTVHGMLDSAVWLFSSTSWIIILNCICICRIKD